MTRDTFTEAQKVATIREPAEILRRKTDGALFEPSHPGCPDYSSLFGKGSGFFFRRIEPVDVPKRVWLFWRRCLRGCPWS